MFTAVTLRLDDAAARHVRDMQQRLADRGLADDQLKLGYAPHLTLGVWRQSNPQTLRRHVVSQAEAQPHIPLHLTALAHFPGAPAVIWLAPTASASLLSLHARLHAAMADGEPHYCPGNWVPHVTLSTAIADPAAALAALAGSPLPIAATLDRLEVVTFPPVAVRDSHRLTPA